MIITGRAAALIGLGLIPALLNPSINTVIAWVCLCTALFILDTALAASPRQIAVNRTAPGAVRLTQSATSTLTLTNLTTRTARGLVRDAWQPSAGAHHPIHRITIRPHEATRLHTHLTPTRRGDRQAAGLTIRTLGPLRLAGRQVTLNVPATVRVLPEFASRKHLPSRLARLREMDGRAAVHIRGEGTEFDSLRQYVIGDDVRSIDWRATARRADVVVRTWRPERDRRVMIILDTSRTSAARIGDEPRLDSGIEAALLLAALTAKAGDRVELLAHDRSVRARVAAAGGPRLMPALANALAPLEPALVETDWPALVTDIQTRLSQRALVVIISTLEPSAVESGLLPVVDQLARNHQVVLAAVTDPEAEELRTSRADSGQLFDAAAAERAELERAAVTTNLRRRGVEVVTALPESLAPALADTYLALKAAGRL